MANDRLRIDVRDVMNRDQAGKFIQKKGLAKALLLHPVLLRGWFLLFREGGVTKTVQQQTVRIEVYFVWWRAYDSRSNLMEEKK